MKSLQAAIGSKQLGEFVLAEIESRILLNLRAVKALDVEALSAGKENVAPNNWRRPCYQGSSCGWCRASDSW